MTYHDDVETCWSEMPEVVCPRCCARFRPLDGADLAEIGARRSCECCGVELEMLSRTCEWEWSTLAPPEPPIEDLEPPEEPAWDGN